MLKTDMELDWIDKIVDMMQKKMSGNQLTLILDRNHTGSFDVENGLISIETSVRCLRKEIEELEEYKFMYEELCK